MNQSKYIVIVDNQKPELPFINYFEQFDYHVDYFNNLNKLNTLKLTASALLVNSSFINNIDSTMIYLANLNSLALIITIDDHYKEKGIMLLEAGADDFMIKPLLVRELHARINAINRRNSNFYPGKEIFIFDNWRLDPVSRQLFNPQGKEIFISTNEYQLLHLFVTHPQKVLARSLLVSLTQHVSVTACDRKVDVQISRLREKMKDPTKHSSIIKTIRNQGYLFTSRVITIREHLT